MSEFYKQFLLDDLKRAGAGSRGIFLGAFGKHPAWDDHMEALGLETESLIMARTFLYVQGLGGQIDSGAWEKLDPAQQLPLFKHLFLWLRGRQLLVGRMWSSTDGKGRKRYPMIVCAQVAGAGLDWALTRVLPRLEQIEQACVLAAAASEVRQILDHHRSALREEAASATEGAATDRPPKLSADQVAAFVAHPALGPNHEGWCRILYQMQDQFAAFAPGKFSLKGDLDALRPQQMRVPAFGASPAESLVLWGRFFQMQLDAGTPLLLTLPIEEGWLDATLGEPTPHEMFCLRATPRALPLASEVPYSLEDGFRQRAREWLAAFQQNAVVSPGKSGDTTAFTAAPSAPSAQGKGRWFRWFGS